MKLIYGTTNLAKVQHMRDMLRGLDLELVGLNDVEQITVDVNESGNNPLENARIKAKAYFDIFRTPVFSCDSGLYIDGLELQDQPGVHIRRVNDTELTDEQMLEHYSTLAASYGGRVKARYRNAICLVVNEQHMYMYDGDDIASEEFFIVQDPHPQRISGFPLDSLSVECETERYYFDIGQEKGDAKYDTSQAFGFRRFFEGALFASSVYYHGTKANLEPGDFIVPGFKSNYGKRRKASYVYLTETLDAAIWGAELAVGEEPGRIYIVEPCGPIEDDPNLTDKKFPGNPTKSYRSKDRLRVIGEVPEWQGHPLEQLQAMKERLDELKRLGIEAIED